MAGAMAVGAEIEIKELPGYLPILRHDSMEKVLRENINFIGIKNNEIIKTMESFSMDVVKPVIINMIIVK